MKPVRTAAWAAAAGIGLALSIASVAASAGNPVEERQATMKQVGQTMKEASAFTSAQTPYDAAKVKALMDGLAPSAKKLKGLYPATSASDPKTAADPKIWQNKADFESKIPPVAKAIADAKGTINDVGTLKVAYDSINGKCNECHETYRLKLK